MTLRAIVLVLLVIALSAASGLLAFFISGSTLLTAAVSGGTIFVFDRLLREWVFGDKPAS